MIKRRRHGREAGQTYSVIGMRTDDGSTMRPVAIMHGDVRPLLANGRPPPGAILYVITDAADADVATHRAVEDYEAEEAEPVWEPVTGDGGMYFI